MKILRKVSPLRTSPVLRYEVTTKKPDNLYLVFGIKIYTIYCVVKQKPWFGQSFFNTLNLMIESAFSSLILTISGKRSEPLLLRAFKES